MKKFTRDDFEKFHDYGCFIPNRIIYFGSEAYSEDGDSENGVDHESSKRIIKNLTYLDSVEKAPIQIYWNSCGGHFDKGMAIYDAIKGVRSKVTMVGFGMVRSMGTIIMQACDERLLSPHCDFMIHDGSCWSGGESKTVINWAEYEKKTLESMYNIYLDKIRMKHPEFKKSKLSHMCSHDCILDGQEAVDLGLADRVL